MQVAGNLIRSWVFWDAGLTPAQYTERMRKIQQWGGGVELALLAHLYPIHVTVYQARHSGMLPADARISLVSSFGAADAQHVLHVLYVGRAHYDVLLGVTRLPLEVVDLL